MMGLGIWFLVDPNISDKLDFISFGADKMFKAAAITMIVVGILILVIGFLGCCGACRESSGMLCMVSEPQASRTLSAVTCKNKTVKIEVVCLDINGYWLLLFGYLSLIFCL